MTKYEYSLALRRPEWKRKRLIILKRDKFKCRKCSKTTTLQVHHKYYLEDKQPWEVPNGCLITLCKTCHEKEHLGRKIGTFIRKKAPKKRVYVKYRKTKKVKNKFGRLKK